MGIEASSDTVLCAHSTWQSGQDSDSDSESGYVVCFISWIPLMTVPCLKSNNKL